MPFWFILALIALAVGVVALVASFTLRRDSEKATARVVVAGGVVVFVLFSLISGFTVVSTRTVGIVTTYGRPESTLDNGPHMVWPWQEVTEMPESIQLQSFASGKFQDGVDGKASDGSDSSAVKVRLANNSTAYVNENLNWRLREGSAARLFQDYKDFDNIKKNLVDKQAEVALAKTFAKFDPQTLTPTSDPNNPTVTPKPAQGADLPALAAQVKQDLQDAVGGDIEIIDVRIPAIAYDDPTQSRIDAFNQKVQDTKNATQDVATATQDALANEKRNAAPNIPGGVPPAIALCLHDTVAAGKDPAGCWGQIGGTPLIQLPPK